MNPQKFGLVREIFPAGMSGSPRPIRHFEFRRGNRFADAERTLQSRRVIDLPDTPEGNDHFRIARDPPGIASKASDKPTFGYRSACPVEPSWRPNPYL